MGENNYDKMNKNLCSLVIIFGIVIIILIAYIAIIYINNTSKISAESDVVANTKETSTTESKTQAISNKYVEIISSGFVVNNNVFAAKIKNISNEDLQLVTPVLIVYNSSNIPEYIVSGESYEELEDTIDIFKKGETRYVGFDFYDFDGDFTFSNFDIVLVKNIEKYSDSPEEYVEEAKEIEQIKNKITFESSISNKSLGGADFSVTGRNSSSESLDLKFVIFFYNNNDIVEMSYISTEVEPESAIDAKDYITSPEKYTSYEVVLVVE